MTKQAAINTFFSSFGMPAYPSSAVPDIKSLSVPYLTYDGTVGNSGDSVSITVNVYMKTTSEAVINRKVEEIANTITKGGIVISYDDGTVWIKMGNPWCNSLEESSTIKRRILNVELEFV